jgi:hypothetical protein
VSSSRKGAAARLAVALIAIAFGAGVLDLSRRGQEGWRIAGAGRRPCTRRAQPE